MATNGALQSLLLMLQSGISPSGLRGPSGVQKIKPRSAAVLFLMPHLFVFFRKGSTHLLSQFLDRILDIWEILLLLNIFVHSFI